MRRTFQMPESIQIFGQTIKTVRCPEKIYEAGGDIADGLAFLNRNEIHIHTPEERPNLTLNTMYMHELMHFMIHLSTGGNSALTVKEQFIHGTSTLIYQYFDSAVYKSKSDFIPEKFQLGAVEIKVKKKREVLDGEGRLSYAYTDLYSNLIEVSNADSEHCPERIEVAFCLQLLIFFSYFLHDMIANRHSKIYVPWSYVLHQVLRQLIKE